jgi:hypothetical protein
MRQRMLLLSFTVLLFLGTIQPAQAVVVTNGGPGGMGTTDGSSTLELWLKADTQTFSDLAGTTAATTVVRRWNDLSGNNRNALADVSGREPTLVAGLINGAPGINFTGGPINTGSRMTVASNSYPMTGNETAFFTLDFDPALGCCRGILSGNDSPNRAYAGGSNGMFEADPYTYATNYRIQGVDTPAVSGTDFKVITGENNLTPPGNVTLRLGSGHGGNADYGGRMGEVILFSDKKNLAQELIVENYLSARHNSGGTVVAVVNRTLGANDHYAGDLASNANYDFQVFGIGQTSPGVNHLSGGSAGFGLEATSLDDNEWLMAGHDTTANSLLTYEDGNPDTSTQRWNRAWYVDKTGVLDATLAFDFEDAGLTLPGPGTSYQLLYSADSNFSDGFQTLAATNSITSGTVAFALNNGMLLDGYYTLGMIATVPEPNSMLLLMGVLSCGMLRRRRCSKDRD